MHWVTRTGRVPALGASSSSSSSVSAAAASASRVPSLGAPLGAAAPDTPGRSTVSTSAPSWSFTASLRVPSKERWTRLTSAGGARPSFASSSRSLPATSVIPAGSSTPRTWIRRNTWFATNERTPFGASAATHSSGSPRDGVGGAHTASISTEREGAGARHSRGPVGYPRLHVHDKRPLRARAPRRDGHLAVLTLDRPERRNAMNGAMWDSLEGAVGVERALPRVVILAGEGEKAFRVVNLRSSTSTGP